MLVHDGLHRLIAASATIEAHRSAAAATSPESGFVPCENRAMAHSPCKSRRSGRWPQSELIVNNGISARATRQMAGGDRSALREQTRAPTSN